MAPQSHPQAQFVPMSPDLDLSVLVENTPNFDYVTRLSRAQLEELSIQMLEQLVLLHVVIGGKPLVMEDLESRIDPNLFSPSWLHSHLGKKAVKARDLSHATDIEMTMGHYLQNMDLLTTQFTPSNFRDPRRQRLYLKDMDTPEEWAADLKRFIPEPFYYLNECIESRTGGDGAVLEANEYGQMGYGKGVAPAGDLMSSLPTEMQALNMMCYIGHEGTYTPAHREMCASLGHNIMVEASQDKHGEKAGSSVWFMTETKEREVVSEYFLSMLGHDIEVEKHFAQVNAWKKAPFNVWVVEQRPGDLILIPPLAPHQVWNRGTRTIKAAWNRTTVDTLELALHEALPRARMVCRDEQYKNKAIIYYTLIKYHKLLLRDTVEPKMWKYGRIKQLIEDFKRLYALYGEILVSEMFGAQLLPEKDVEMLPYDSNVTCSYCRCNIFNRFLTCKSCNTGPDDTYDICMDCYAMGRSCSCISNLNWVEQWQWSTLTSSYESWRQTLVHCDGYFDSQKSPQPLEIARKRYGRKPVAQICQEQLKIRPWQDPTKAKTRSPSPGMSDVEPEVDDSGRLKKRQRYSKKLQPVKNKTSPCHIGQNHEWNWKLAFCTTCSNKYSYGSLWRAFDIMPQEVMEDRDWSCPKCQGICSCGKCRKDPRQTPYSPKGTLLGHDTILVADHRSVESLVDFSKTNLGWLRDEGNENPQESIRMRRLKEKAEKAKAREDVIDENYVDNSDQTLDDEAGHMNIMHNFEGLVDPALEDYVPASHAVPHAPENGDHETPYASPQAVQSGSDEAGIDRPQDWLDGHYGLGSETLDTSRTGYPSKLLIQSVAGAASDVPFVDPGGFTKARMVGVGYYQQAGSADQILYIPPDTPDSNSEHSASATATLALSDLVSYSQAEESNKRKSGEEGEDGESFSSKRQKKLAKEKKHLQPPDDTSHTPANAQRKPRRSAGMAQTDIELDEDMVSFTEEGMAVRKPLVDVAEDTALALARPALSQLEDIPTARQTPRQSPLPTMQLTRGSGRLRGTQSSSTTPAKNPRDSAWLNKKNADDDGNPPEFRKRTRKTRASSHEVPGPLFGVETPPGSESGGNVRIEDDVSHFEESEARESGNESGIQWRPSSQNPNVRVAEPVTRPDKSVPRRRGRPLKQTRSALPAPKVKVEEPEESGQPVFEDPADIPANGTIADAENNMKIAASLTVAGPERSSIDEEQPFGKQSGRPPKHVPKMIKSAIEIQVAGPTRMVSLKEKLASKGRSFKIIAPKSRQAFGSQAENSTAQSSPAAVEASQGRFTAASSPTTSRISSKYGSPAMSPTKPFANGSTSRASAQEGDRPKHAPSAVRLSDPPAVKMGPTVVRLMSTDGGSDTSDDSDSSDDSIPAVKPPPESTTSGVSVAGRPVGSMPKMK